jgi:hypothetical protein
MITMRRTDIGSLAAMKRAIRPGVVIYVPKHWQPQLVETTRVVESVQGNGYYFMGQTAKGETKRMWAPYPKRSELAFGENGDITFYPGCERSWTIVIGRDQSC